VTRRAGNREGISRKNCAQHQGARKEGGRNNSDRLGKGALHLMETITHCALTRFVLGRLGILQVLTSSCWPLYSSRSFSAFSNFRTREIRLILIG